MGASWGPRGASWGSLGRLVVRLGHLLGASCGLLGRLGCILGASWGHLGVSRRPRGASGADPVGKTRSLGAPWDPSKASKHAFIGEQRRSVGVLGALLGVCRIVKKKQRARTSAHRSRTRAHTIKRSDRGPTARPRSSAVSGVGLVTEQVQ